MILVLGLLMAYICGALSAVTLLAVLAYVSNQNAPKGR